MTLCLAAGETHEAGKRSAVEGKIGGPHLRVGGGRRGGKSKTAKAANAKSASTKRRKRATITDEIRAEVKKLVGAGKTGGEIARSVGISLPSVQNVKKALGLVRKKSK